MIKPGSKGKKDDELKGKRKILEAKWQRGIVGKESRDSEKMKSYNGFDVNTSEIIDLEDVIKSSAVEQLPSGINELKGDAKVSAFLLSMHEHLTTKDSMVSEEAEIELKNEEEFERDIKTNRSPFRRSRSRQSRDVPRVVLKRTKTLPARFGIGADSEDGTETFTESDDGSTFAITGSPAVSPRASLRGRPARYYSDSEQGSAFAVTKTRTRLDSDAFLICNYWKFQRP